MDRFIAAGNLDLDHLKALREQAEEEEKEDRERIQAFVGDFAGLAASYRSSRLVEIRGEQQEALGRVTRDLWDTFFKFNFSIQVRKLV